MSTLTTTTLLADLQVAQDIVTRLGADRVNSVDVSGNRSTRQVSIHPANRADGHDIAAELGLAPRYLLGDDARSWHGAVDGVPVIVFGDLSVGETWTYSVTNDSDPGDPQPSSAWAETEAGAVTAARNEYGHLSWDQSGGNEYAYVDAYGRTGYVYVTAVSA